MNWPQCPSRNSREVVEEIVGYRIEPDGRRKVVARAWLSGELLEMGRPLFHTSTFPNESWYGDAKGMLGEAGIEVHIHFRGSSMVKQFKALDFPQ